MNEFKKYYLTKQGLKKIKDELQKLTKIKKLKIKKEDISLLHSDELDAEFVAFREDFDYLESRISELEHILKNFEIIKPPAKKQRGQVHLGAYVCVEAGGHQDDFVIVGTLEANPSEGKISDESPVGNALLGHKVGDVVLISSPIETKFKIKKIRYQTGLIRLKK